MSNPSSLERVGQVLRPTGNKALYGAVAGGVLAVTAMFGGGQSETLTPGQGGLTRVALKAGEYCGSEMQADVNDIKATWHYHKGFSWVPDIANRSQTLDGTEGGEICVETKGLYASLEKQDGKYHMRLYGDPDPAKSDLKLIAYKIDGTYTPSGNLVVAIAKASSEIRKSIQQAIGIESSDPIDALDGKLQTLDDLQAANVISASCATMALQKLTDPNAKNVERIPGPNEPRTLQEQLVSDLFLQNPLTAGAHLQPSDFVVDVSLSPAGIPNQFRQQEKNLEEDAKNRHISFNFPKPTDIPPCIDKLGGKKS